MQIPNCNALLGLDWLKKVGARLDFNTCTLHFKEKMISLLEDKEVRIEDLNEQQDCFLSEFSQENEDDIEEDIDWEMKKPVIEEIDFKHTDLNQMEIETATKFIKRK